MIPARSLPADPQAAPAPLALRDDAGLRRPQGAGRPVADHPAGAFTAVVAPLAAASPRCCACWAALAPSRAAPCSTAPTSPACAQGGRAAAGHLPRRIRGARTDHRARPGRARLLNRCCDYGRSRRASRRRRAGRYRADQTRPTPGADAVRRPAPARLAGAGAGAGHRHLLLDEPTTFLDIRHQLDLLDLCARLHAAGRTLVVVLRPEPGVPLRQPASS